VKTTHSASTYHAGGNIIITTAGGSGDIAVQASSPNSDRNEPAPPVGQSRDGKKDNDSSALKVGAYLSCESSFMSSSF
jgi:hypothetical protein